MNVDGSDDRAPYLVMFSDGLQFRYQPSEVESLEKGPQRSVFESVLRVIGETRQSLFHPKSLSSREKVEKLRQEKLTRS